MGFELQSYRPEVSTRQSCVPRGGTEGGPVLPESCVLCTLQLPVRTEAPGVDAVLFHAESHQALGHAEDPRRLRHVAAAGFEGLGDHLALHVVERYTRIGPDHIQYEATIEDPKVFARPWTISLPLYRRREPNVRLLEYECYAYLESQRDGIQP